jgi:hypothetical protein
LSYYDAGYTLMFRVFLAGILPCDVYGCLTASMSGWALLVPALTAVRLHGWLTRSQRFIDFDGYAGAWFIMDRHCWHSAYCRPVLPQDTLSTGSLHARDSVRLAVDVIKPDQAPHLGMRQRELRLPPFPVADSLQAARIPVPARYTAV